MNLVLDTKNCLETLNGNKILSYLSLEGKAEKPFRDHLAFYLYKKYADKMVKIEYNSGFGKIDLAILNSDGTPEILIEIKASYAFDLAEPKISKFVKEAIVDDYNKLQKIPKKVKKYVILISTNLHKNPEKYVNPYSPKIKKFLADNDQKTFFEKSKRNIKKIISSTSLKMIDSKNIKLGKSYGIDNDLFYYIFE
jgi:hypothetical protein